MSRNGKSVFFSQDEVTQQERLSVSPSVGRSVGPSRCRSRALLVATYAVYMALFYAFLVDQTKQENRKQF